MTYTLVLHGGAGARPHIDYAQQRRHMAELISVGQQMLESGHTALETVSEMVAAMEVSGLYVAGKGSAPNTDGVVELDASIMEGGTRRAGAVSAVCNIVNPVKAALGVLEDGEHVMLTAQGAQEFALARGLDAVTDADTYYNEHEGHGSGESVASHGTVGAVALDTNGKLAAATSTGGTFNKRPGRVGDTPLIGAGTWADDLVAVSCTGIGEAFIKTSAAYDVAARVRYGDASLESAAQGTLAQVKQFGGDGGLIAIDKSGQFTMPFNSQGMKRAAVSNTMSPVVRVFETEDPEPI